MAKLLSGTRIYGNATVDTSITVGTNVAAANVVITNASRLGTVTSGTWNGSSISTTYTDAKVTSVNGQTGAATGFATTANTLAQFASTTSAQLATLISDETGSGALVFASSPTFTGNILADNLTLSGNLIVSGTTTTINTTTLTVDDKNIELGSTASPSDVTADGGGITLKGTTDKTFNYVNATTAWTSSEDLNLLTGKSYEINGTSVLSSSGLGSGILASNLTSVGTISSGTWQGSAISTTYTAAKVTTVAGQTGAISNAQLASAVSASGILTTANVSEVTNLYFTNARSRTSISTTGTKGSYNSSTGVFDFANIANVNVTASAPSSPNIGDIWIDDATGKSFIYFNDGSSSQWVEQFADNVYFAPVPTTMTVRLRSGTTYLSVPLTNGNLPVKNRNGLTSNVTIS